MPKTIILDPANPHDFTRGELDELVDRLREQAPDTEVLAALRPEEGYGGPWSEALYLWLELKDNIDAVAAIAATIKWLKGRWERDRDKHPPPQKPRARSLTVIEEERIVRRVTIDLPKGEAVKEELDLDEALPHSKPSPDEGASGGASGGKPTRSL